MSVANKTREGTGTKLVVLDQGETDSEDARKFFELLGCSEPSKAIIALA